MDDQSHDVIALTTRLASLLTRGDYEGAARMFTADASVFVNGRRLPHDKESVPFAEFTRQLVNHVADPHVTVLSGLIRCDAPFVICRAQARSLTLGKPIDFAVRVSMNIEERLIRELRLAFAPGDVVSLPRYDRPPWLVRLTVAVSPQVQHVAPHRDERNRLPCV